jgi:hypothetical protein
MLYWLTVWIVGLSVLTAATSAPIALFAISVWLLGTVFVSKGLGRPVGFVFSWAVGFVSCMVIGAIFAHREHFMERFAVCFLVGLEFGLGVWCLAVAADEAFQRFAARRAD